jgi:4-diphosphocytidyl-2-C-methyl-D-erythritol kinase
MAMNNGRPSVMVVPAPAKLNLFLHVTGRRADGYHELESLFVLVDLADRVTLELREDGAIQRAGDVPGVPESACIALAAARKLKEATGTRFGASIGIDKRIPMGAGLGGGSSDAASVLMALNRLWRTRVDRRDLADLGASLGADVPFFLGGGAAFVRGIGERLSPASVPRAQVLLLRPDAHVSTGAIFGAPDLTRSTPSAKMEVFSEGYGRNDLAPVARDRFPAVAAALDALAALAPQARMTGSGSCVFAAFADENDAMRVARSLPKAFDARIVRTIGKHPLAAFA